MLTLLRRRAASRNESGAVAIIFALMTLMLLTVAALGTDIGNAVGRRSDTQTQADFGAFAAAEKMSNTASPGQAPSAAVLNAVMTALNNNQPQDDKAACWRAKTCVTSTAQLTDADLTNGDVRYTSAGLQVTAPNHYVGFGMAQVMGYPGVSVGAKATVNVYSPGLRVLPMFAVQGCDYGLQTLADPANGHDSPVVPPLAFDTDANSTKLESLVLLNGTGTPVNSLTSPSTGNQLQLTASNWTKTTKIGFFRSDSADPTLVQSQPTFWLQGDATKTSLSPYSRNPSTTVQLNIPDAVTQTQTVWYVRVFNSDTGADDLKWSPRPEALPIRVGNAVLECNQGSTDGNFGTLKLPRYVPNQTSSWLPVNIANGLQSPLSLTKHQGYALDSPTGKCVNGTPADAVTSPTSPAQLNAYTNCVSTDTGLSANDATQGLISGLTVSGVTYPGLLTTAGTKSGCAPDGSSNTRSVNISGPGGPYIIDNANLTCYLKNGTSLADIGRASYSGGAALDKSIVDDPRFVWVPIVLVKPDCGTCSNYSIIDIRPAFITDEQPFATSVRNSNMAANGGTLDNGLTVANNGLTALKVFFFNIDAMPRDVTDHVIDYLGVGQPIIRLVN